MDVRVGTWNLENLFRPGGDFGPKSDEVYQRKLDGLAATIGRMAPDLLGVQEVGEPAAMDDLLARLGDGWHAALSAHFDPGHPIRVGFLSRHPLTVVEDLSAHPRQLSPVQLGDPAPNGVVAAGTRMGRGALAVRIQPAGGRALQAVCCHLKSKLLSFPPGPSGAARFQPYDEGERARVGGYALFRRAGEAVTVRGLATRLLGVDHADGRQNAVVVLGDLNDEPAAATTQILLGPPGSQLDTPGFAVPDRGDALRLWNLANRIPPAERFTRRFEGHGEYIDHLLVSRCLLDPLPEVDVVRQDGSDHLPSVTSDAAVRRDAPASDHAAVLAHLTL